MNPNLSLQGKVALITGAGKGIGRAMALAFAEAGADLAICSQSGALSEVAQGVEALGRQVVTVKADVSQKVDVDNMVQKAVDKFGRIDILVNNAAMIIRALFMEATEADWDKIVDVDLKGSFLCAQAVGKVMMKQGKGSIINFSSQRGFEYAPGNAVYSIAKAGVLMLTRVLTLELGKYGIRVNVIAPGLVRTDQSKVYWQDKEFMKKREAIIPLGRVADPPDLIGAALFLASEASAYISGTTIFIDGGILA